VVQRIKGVSVKADLTLTLSCEEREKAQEGKMVEQASCLFYKIGDE
jgi:hypothetical protein